MRFFYLAIFLSFNLLFVRNDIDEKELNLNNHKHKKHTKGPKLISNKTDNITNHTKLENSNNSSNTILIPSHNKTNITNSNPVNDTLNHTKINSNSSKITNNKSNNIHYEICRVHCEKMSQIFDCSCDLECQYFDDCCDLYSPDCDIYFKSK